MSSVDRRTFLTGMGAGAALAMTQPRHTANAASASESITVGIVGCSRGAHLAKEFKPLNINIAYLCDTDIQRAERTREMVGSGKAIGDLRTILDDKSIDAVVIATPDHWHAPAAILACEAGKHVYVEKPCAHNIREGRALINVARKTGRVVQVGSQSRSTTFIKNGIELLREGAIGEVRIAKAWNSQLRANIGHAQPSAPPKDFDYDTWIGPAEMRPFQSNRHHYTWHWWYDFGTGDMGNDGVHELDIAAWGLGVDCHPSKITGHGSKLHFDDDQQFPDTQYVCYEYPQTDNRRKLLIYEQRIWSPFGQEGAENGNIFYGSEGYLYLAKGSGWKLFGKKNQLIREEKGSFSVAEHATDFVNAIRNGSRPSADIEIGHRSATLAHLGNILARTGKGCLEFNATAEQFVNDVDANTLVGRTYREEHWSVPEILRA